jgi:hypothetical protein
MDHPYSCDEKRSGLQAALLNTDHPYSCDEKERPAGFRI